MYTGESYRERPLIHVSAVEMMQKGKYRPKNVRHGLHSLRPLEVNGQKPGGLYLYEPGDDPRPFWNRFAVRWSVMLTVGATELAAVVLVLWGAWIAFLLVIRLTRGG